MKKLTLTLVCLSILVPLSESAVADSTEATKEAIFDQAFVEEHAAHLESLYGDVAADLWNEEELKGYEAFLHEIIGPNAKSYVKENFDTYKPLPVFRFEDSLPPVVDVYDLTPFIEDGDLAAVFDKGFDPYFPEEFLLGASDSEEKAGDPVIESVAAGICQIDPQKPCIVCGHSESTSVRVAIGTNNSEELLKICASWDSGQTWFLTGYSSLVDDYSVPYDCFKFNGGPASEVIQFVQNAIHLPNPNNYCDFDNYSSQFTGQNSATGNSGYDEIHGSQYADQLSGEFVVGYDGDDQLSIQYTTAGVNARNALGMYGNDRIYGSNYADYLWGGYGDDTIYGYGGNDFLYGHENSYIVQYYYGEGWEMYYDEWESEGQDRISGGTGNDTICGGAGFNFPGYERIDYLHGEGGNDYIWGDFCECTDPHGMGGNSCEFGNMDEVYAGSGYDHAYGGRMEDLIDGGGGMDTLYGGPELDIIVGGNEYDACWGGFPPPKWVQGVIIDDIVSCEWSCPDCGNSSSCDPC